MSLFTSCTSRTIWTDSDGFAGATRTDRMKGGFGASRRLRGTQENRGSVNGDAQDAIRDFGGVAVPSGLAQLAAGNHGGEVVEDGLLDSVSARSGDYAATEWTFSADAFEVGHVWSKRPDTVGTLGLGAVKLEVTDTSRVNSGELVPMAGSLTRRQTREERLRLIGQIYDGLTDDELQHVYAMMRRGDDGVREPGYSGGKLADSVLAEYIEGRLRIGMVQQIRADIASWLSSASWMDMKSFARPGMTPFDGRAARNESATVLRYIDGLHEDAPSTDLPVIELGIHDPKTWADALQKWSHWSEAEDEVFTSGWENINQLFRIQLNDLQLRRLWRHTWLGGRSLAYYNWLEDKGISIANFIPCLKAGSCIWLHDARDELSLREWQDDTAIRRKPRRQVDYLSHEWRESDILLSWRYVTTSRRAYESDYYVVRNEARLENAAWRTWTKTRYRLGTTSPQTIKWLKDTDVTWLYGPFITESEESEVVQAEAIHSLKRASSTSTSKKSILVTRPLSIQASKARQARSNHLPATIKTARFVDVPGADRRVTFDDAIDSRLSSPLFGPLDDDRSTERIYSMTKYLNEVTAEIYHTLPRCDLSEDDPKCWTEALKKWPADTEDSYITAWSGIDQLFGIELEPDIREMLERHSWLAAKSSRYQLWMNGRGFKIGNVIPALQTGLCVWLSGEPPSEAKIVHFADEHENQSAGKADYIMSDSSHPISKFVVEVSAIHYQSMPDFQLTDDDPKCWAEAIKKWPPETDEDFMSAWSGIEQLFGIELEPEVRRRLERHSWLCGRSVAYQMWLETSDCKIGNVIPALRAGLCIWLDDEPPSSTGMDQPASRDPADG